MKRGGGERLVKLGVVFALMGALSIYLWISRMPGAHNKNPLAKINFSNIEKIAVQNPSGAVQLEKEKDVWEVTAPVRDVADPKIASAIITAFESFSVGSRISENPAKYAQFNIEDQQATKFALYVKGVSAPVLDGYAGKTTEDYRSCYFRFAGAAPVYVAQGVPLYQLNRNPKDFRQPHVVALKREDVTAISASHDKLHVELVRSSDTWTRLGGTAPLDTVEVTQIVERIENLTAMDFASGQETPVALGFSKPFLSIKIDVKGAPIIVMAGAKAPVAVKGAVVGRYVKTEGREAVLVIAETSLGYIIDALKALPK